MIRDRFLKLTSSSELQALGLSVPGRPTVRLLIEEALATHGELTPQEIALLCYKDHDVRLNVGTIQTTLSRLAKAGHVKSTARNLYKLVATDSEDDSEDDSGDMF